MRTVVVGGGIAGLTTAWHLHRAGQQVTVLEASDTLGGALQSRVVAGIDLNAGAEGFAVATSSVFDLVDDLGLRKAVVTPRQGRSWILNVRGAHPSPETSYLGIPAHPLAADVMAILGTDAAHHAANEATLDPTIGYRPGISLGEYVTHRMGRAVRDLLVEPVVGGVHSTHPDLLELDSIAPRLHEAVLCHGSLQAAVRVMRAGRESAGAAIAGLAPTMGLLPTTIAQRLREGGHRVVTRTPVTAVLPHRDDAGIARGWTVRTWTGDISADQVVMATPVNTTRELLAELPEVAASIPTVPTSAIALATIVVDDPRLDAGPRDNGALVSAHTPGVVAKALTHVTAKWEHVRQAAETSAPGQHRHVLRLSYGRSGKHVPGRSELPELALNDARRILGVHLDRDAIASLGQVRWEETMTQARPGHKDALNEVAGRLASHPGLAITGAWMAGTGIAAVTTHAPQVAAHLSGRACDHPVTAEPHQQAPLLPEA